METTKTKLNKNFSNLTHCLLQNVCAKHGFHLVCHLKFVYNIVFKINYCITWVMKYNLISICNVLANPKVLSYIFSFNFRLYNPVVGCCTCLLSIYPGRHNCMYNLQGDIVQLKTSRRCHWLVVRVLVVGIYVSLLFSNNVIHIQIKEILFEVKLKYFKKMFLKQNAINHTNVKQEEVYSWPDGHSPWCQVPYYL